MTSFHDFGLAAPLTRALAEENYVTPTPIQSETIPLVLAGRDLIGIAQTGTGKTAAFALPILQRLSAGTARPQPKCCRVLVLSPTRELSGQITESFRTYGRHLRIRTALAIGGVPIGPQARAIAPGVDVLVATPGRLLDLLQSGALRLQAVEVFVLDEADRMLDMGFIHDIRKIAAKLPAKRQTLMFSATMPQAIAELAGHMLQQPATVAVTPVASTAERISQRVVHVERAQKSALLADLLRSEGVDRVLVFTRTKHGADKVARGLAKSGISAEAIHGNKSQNNRTRVLSAFRDGKVRTLVATDIAARGIDVEGISHVVNFDMPNEPESYVHRIGRTARADAEGTAVSFCSAEEVPYLRAIERLIRMQISATGNPAPQSGSGAQQSHRDQPRSRNGRAKQGRRQQPDRQGKHKSRRGHSDQSRRDAGRARPDEATVSGPRHIASVAFLKPAPAARAERPSAEADRRPR